MKEIYLDCAYEDELNNLNVKSLDDEQLMTLFRERLDEVPDEVHEALDIDFYKDVADEYSSEYELTVDTGEQLYTVIVFLRYDLTVCGNPDPYFDDYRIDSWKPCGVSVVSFKVKQNSLVD